jgi:hypothetical protein
VVEIQPPNQEKAMRLMRDRMSVPALSGSIVAVRRATR